MKIIKKIKNKLLENTDEINVLIIETFVRFIILLFGSIIFFVIVMIVLNDYGDKELKEVFLDKIVIIKIIIDAAI